MRVSTALRKAKALLEKVGWCKGDFGFYKNGKPVGDDIKKPRLKYLSGFCALGAVHRACGKCDSIVDDCIDKLQVIISKKLNNSELVNFNDRVAKRKRDVVSLFNQAIKLAEREESTKN